MKTNAERNILVISDLHLGEDLKPTNEHVSFLRHLVRLERELEAFLRHYTEHRLGGRPWRLVVNGDMVDFMSIMILPDGEGASAEEREYGLGHGEAQSTAKLGRVFERHAGVFRRLAEFVSAGNELVIVVGNHDVEFFYPAVQRAFVDRLTALAEPAAEPKVEMEERFRLAIRFCPWFYYEENLVYVEHGHQYDEYCSFDYQLYPVAPILGGGGGVALSIAHAGIRYFSNLVPTLDPRCGEIWGFMDYMRWAFAHGVRGIVRIFYLYGVLTFRAVEIWSMLTDRAADELRSREHRRALREMARSYRIAVDKLEALDRLRQVPVVRRLFAIFSTLFVDRMLVGVVLAMALAALVVLLPGWRDKLCGAGGLLGLGVLVTWLLGRKRTMESAAALRRVPRIIATIMRAPFIVLGHSHSVEDIELEGGGVYFNTGTWAAAEASEFPHLVIRTGSEPLAELRLWRGAAAPIEVVSSRAVSPPEQTLAGNGTIC